MRVDTYLPWICREDWSVAFVFIMSLVGYPVTINFPPLLFSRRECVEFFSETFWTWRFLFWECQNYGFSLIVSVKVPFRLSISYWINGGSWCISINWPLLI